MLRIATVLGALCVVAASVLLPDLVFAAESPLVRRITLEEAKARAGGATVADLARFSVDAARYHREAAQADYFPKIDSTFANLHSNKFMGQTFQLARRTADIPLLAKDQTAVFFNVTQPITPIFKVNQAVDIARADETIARVKAEQAASQVATNVERIYFGLLIAQRRQTFAEIQAQRPERPVTLEAGKELIAARSLSADLTQSLNLLIGFEPETELELTAPEPVVETVSLHEATQQALANNVEVVEAEQTVVKAKAAANLSKLEYVPDVAVIGGYVHQNGIPALPRDFSYIGVLASVTIFDFGKREKTLSERKAQLAMAETNVELVKAKVAASAQKAFLDLQRTRRIRDLTRPRAGVYQATLVSYQTAGPIAKADHAKAEEDMFQAELDYRLAYFQLKQIIEGR